MGANLISINGIEFTDDGRTISESRDARENEIMLASGKIKKYVMAEKRTWSIDWDLLPSTMENTHDGKGARDELVANIAFNPQPMSFRIRNAISGIDQVYNVFVDDYSEDLVRRDFISGVFLYKVSLSLKEQ